MSNKRERIEVVIRGPVQVGKSALMFLIRDFLQDQLNLQVEFADQKMADEDEELSAEPWEVVLGGFKPDVVLHEELT